MDEELDSLFESYKVWRAEGEEAQATADRKKRESTMANTQAMHDAVGQVVAHMRPHLEKHGARMDEGEGDREGERRVSIIAPDGGRAEILFRPYQSGGTPPAPSPERCLGG